MDRIGLTAREIRTAELVASRLGRPLKPYQREMIATAGTPGGTFYAHSTLVVLMPRQVGKTATTLALVLARMLVHGGYAAAYTAQTGQRAGEIFKNSADGWISVLDANPDLAAAFRTSRAAGSETIRGAWNRGSMVRAFPPVPGRLRGSSLDLVILDECQEHSAETAQELMADIGPVFTTRPRRQMILAGTASGPSWWADQVAAGRAGDVGLVEVGTWPADADPEDPGTWRRHHPGLRAGLTDEAHLAAQCRALGAERFAREYGNVFATAAGAAEAIPDGLWRAAQESGDPPAAPDAIGLDVAGDGSAAAVVAAARDGDRRTVAGLVAAAPGTAWAVGRVAELHRRYPRAAVIADPGGPAGGLVAALRDARIDVQEFTGADRLAGHTYLIAELEAGRARILPHPLLEGARAAAVRRYTDGGGWVWSRRGSHADISPLTAWTMALWGTRRTPSARPRTATAAPAV